MGQHRIDRLDKKILQLISQDARIPFLEVARECNVSGAAIHQRIQKLKNNGIIKGESLNLTIAERKAFAEVAEELKKIPEIVECHYSTGKYSLFVKIYARDNKHLLQVIVDRMTSINGIAHTETFQISLDEVFRRQLSVFETEEPEEDEITD